MASSGGLTQIFKKPLPDNPTLIEYLSPAYQIRPPAPLPVTPALEFFGELNFFTKKTDSNPPSPYPRPHTPEKLHSDKKGGNKEPEEEQEHKRVRKVKNLQKLRSFESICTEGLGFESTGELDDDAIISGGEAEGKIRNGNRNRYVRSRSDVSSMCCGGFPPPISCITKSGKPSIFLRPYRKDGMLILKEFRIARELHSTREDGRLRMHFMKPDEDDGAEEEEGRWEKGGKDRENNEPGNGDGDLEPCNVAGNVD